MSTGGRHELWYRWRCDACPSDVVASPPDHRLYARSLSLSALTPGRQYTLFLYAENEISAVVDDNQQPQYYLYEFTTKQLSSLVVRSLRVESMTGDTGVTLAWDAPTVDNDNEPSTVELYQLRYKARGVVGVAEQMQTTKDEHYSLADLNSNREYTFMVSR